MTLEPLTIRKNDAMTAGGQIIGHLTTNLSPVTFRINIPVMPMRVSGSYPYRMGAWRFFPSASLPTVGVAIPAVVAADPDMIPARSRGTMLPDADRRPKPYYDLSTSGCYPKGKAKQRAKNHFSHFLLLRLYQQVYSHHRVSPFQQQK